MAEPDKVYTRDELVKLLTNFLGTFSDDDKAKMAPETLGMLENASVGINQAFDRIDKLNSTIENLTKATEDYKAKIAEYAADQAERMRQSISDDDAENPASQLIEATLEDGD